MNSEDTRAPTMTDEEFLVEFMHHAALMDHGCSPDQMHNYEEMAYD